MTFLTTRSIARILIINLRHRQALLLTRPAVLLGEGRPDTRERRRSSLVTGRQSQKLKGNDEAQPPDQKLGHGQENIRVYWLLTHLQI